MLISLLFDNYFTITGVFTADVETITVYRRWRKYTRSTTTTFIIYILRRRDFVDRRYDRF